MNDKEKKYIPELASHLRKHSVLIPESIYQASGIRIMGTRIKSLIFTTDIALICNNNAQAVFCVYPFTPQINITTAIINAARAPVFVGVGGGTTSGDRVLSLALQAELLGAYGVVVNAPMKPERIRQLSETVDIPIVATVGSANEDYLSKIKAGAGILNVSAAAKTADVVAQIRRDVGPEYPIIATGGPTDETIMKTIAAGANAITYTPPTSGDIFHEMMVKYRELE